MLEIMTNREIVRNGSFVSEWHSRNCSCNWLKITNYKLFAEYLSSDMGYEFQSARIIKYDVVSLYCVTMASTLIGMF